ncbi:MAG: hypothetical protein K0S74_122 [Chlamydiales bacterium]|jgi:hypothetical protein|nr:hypothetical protein [Chlamydiales bacterium]
MDVNNFSSTDQKESFNESNSQTKQRWQVKLPGFSFGDNDDRNKPGKPEVFYEADTDVLANPDLKAKYDTLSADDKAKINQILSTDSTGYISITDKEFKELASLLNMSIVDIKGKLQIGYPSLEMVQNATQVDKFMSAISKLFKDFDLMNLSEDQTLQAVLDQLIKILQEVSTGTTAFAKEDKANNDAINTAVRSNNAKMSELNQQILTKQKEEHDREVQRQAEIQRQQEKKKHSWGNILQKFFTDAAYVVGAGVAAAVLAIPNPAGVAGALYMMQNSLIAMTLVTFGPILLDTLIESNILGSKGTEWLLENREALNTTIKVIALAVALAGVAIGAASVVAPGGAVNALAIAMIISIVIGGIASSLMQSGLIDDIIRTKNKNSMSDDEKNQIRDEERRSIIEQQANIDGTTPDYNRELTLDEQVDLAQRIDDRMLSYVHIPASEEENIRNDARNQITGGVDRELTADEQERLTELIKEGRDNYRALHPSNDSMIANYVLMGVAMAAGLVTLGTGIGRAARAAKDAAKAGAEIAENSASLNSQAQRTVRVVGITAEAATNGGKIIQASFQIDAAIAERAAQYAIANSLQESADTKEQIANQQYLVELLKALISFLNKMLEGNGSDKMLDEMLNQFQDVAKLLQGLRDAKSSQVTNVVQIQQAG